MTFDLSKATVIDRASYFLGHSVVVCSVALVDEHNKAGTELDVTAGDILDLIGDIVFSSPHFGAAVNKDFQRKVWEWRDVIDN